MILSAFKEIVTKAVIGKGKKYYKNSYTIETEFLPTTVLGCWVINHSFKGTDVGGKIVINGSFDVNVWYSYENDTKTTVITKKITYSEAVMVRQKETTDTTTKDIIVRSLKQPSCTNAKENGKTINIEIEKELGIEVVGDTKIKVPIEEEEDPWDLIDDNEYNEEVSTEIDKSIKKDYLKEDYLKNNTDKETTKQKE